MKIYDLLGSELAVGDLVSVKSDHLVGIVIKAEDGTIAKGLSVSGQPRGEVNPPHLIIKVDFTTVVPAIGGAANVLKVVKPEAKKELVQ
jgi:hypothetical protein